MSLPSIKRINRLAKSFEYKSFLEVGVSKGHTFFGVNMEEKTAVDPKFQFDIEALPDSHPHQKFFAIPSDQFFIQHNKADYDMIFLDGLHTFEQTLRDFCNAIMCSKKKSLILIDDTVPSDIYSAHPVSSKAVQLRKKETQSESNAWHGDVYKVVFAIAEFFPLWSYKTIMTGGNPQTILWRQPRQTPGLFSSLEAISRLSYFDFLKNIDVLNPVDDFESIILDIKAAHDNWSI